MTARADGKRQRWALRLGFAAVVSAALAFAVVARDAAGRRVETIEGLVAPGWSEDFAQAQTIRVATAADTLTVVRGPDGWSLQERGGHAVEDSALTALHRSLTTLTFSGARTGDPANHERLGVTDPEDGGSGMRLTVTDAAGEPLADWIVGLEREGGAFIRRPDEDQAYAASGTLPDLESPAFWINLDFLRIARVDIERAVVEPEGGRPTFILARGAPAASDFALIEPAEGLELITVGAANGPGAAMSDLRFFDVKPKPALAAEAPAGRHTARTFDGLEVTLELFREGEETWASVAASAVDGASAAAVAKAELLNERGEGWLYKLPPYAADRLIRPLDTIARPIGEPREQER